MTRLSRTSVVDTDGLANLRTPRTDLVTERPDGPDRWTMIEGPFVRYERTLTVEPAPPADPSGPGTDRGRGTGTGADSGTEVERSGDTGLERWTVTERHDYKLAIPLWWPYMWIQFRLALADHDRRPRKRWWWSKDVVDARTTSMLALLGTIGMMGGYLGTLIGQTITFAAEDFGAPDDAQANTLALVRVGVLLSVIFLGLADRIGRRPLTLWFALAAIVFTASGAFVDGLFTLGLSQTVARGLTTGLLTLVTLAATEEVAAANRALTVAVMTLMTGLGSAMMLWALPLADLGPGAWRITYALPLVFLPLLWWISSRLPETRRFQAAEQHDSPGTINWGRFVLLGSASFLSFVFAAPAAQLRNEFLRDDLGYTAAEITGFQLLAFLPATAAVPIGGVMADRYGRKRWGASMIALASVFGAVSYLTEGWVLWVTSGLSFCASAASVPAMQGYSTELFPTRARGRVGGLLSAVAVAGSATGLVLAGQLSVAWGDLGQAVAVLAIAPMVVAVLVVVAFPETAQRELEDFNPDDPDMGGGADGSGPGPEPGTGPGAVAEGPGSDRQTPGGTSPEAVSDRSG